MSNKICKNCSQNFEITSDDFSFYEKIKVPSPTWCPECRMMRRWSWRNERTLHRVTCATTNKSIISGFAPDAGYMVYERDYWWSDAWDPTSYGVEYDFSKSFFEQFNALMHRVPHPAVFNSRTTNCEYSMHTGESKNGYLISASWRIEDCAYASRTGFSKDFMDCYATYHSELCYEVVSSLEMSRSFFADRSDSSNDCFFIFDCKGCTSCFGCTNLRSKSYYIFNEPYTKEEYKKKIQEFDLGSYQSLQKVKEKFAELKRSAIHKFSHTLNAQNSTGDNIRNVMNCHECFDITDAKDCKYSANGGFNMNDSYDGYGVGEHAELLYEVFDTGVQATRLLFGGIIWGGHDVLYSYNLQNCENCFGCIGLRKKSYCILNKQYSKEDYESLLPKIIEQMTKAGEYGEFFPTSISPFGYNETIAQDYFPLTKEQAVTKGWKWRDPEKSSAQITKKADELPDHIKDASEDILKEIIECSSCHKPYRFIKKELDFLKRFNIALPRKCFECRHLDRFHQVNFPRLYQRSCMCAQNHPHHQGQCPNEFETSYSPERKEIVYCEDCYQHEVI